MLVSIYRVCPKLVYRMPLFSIVSGGYHFSKTDPDCMDSP
jgi:hypothetical protein